MHQTLELELAGSSQLVAGVGPLLASTIKNHLRGVVPAPDVFRLIPPLKEWGRQADPNDPPTSKEFLVLGRSDDLKSKGLDIAARAIAIADAWLRNHASNPPVLAVRGVLPQDEKKTRKELTRLAGAAQVLLRPYSTLETELQVDIFSATTVLLPSRHEGFGLSAYEAIAAGVPVLVSDSSGLGQLILELDPQAPEVLPTTGTTSALEEWSRAIIRNAEHPRAAFIRAAELKNMFGRFSWGHVATQIEVRLSP